jgi:hypothetical protein
MSDFTLCRLRIEGFLRRSVSCSVDDRLLDVLRDKAE